MLDLTPIKARHDADGDLVNLEVWTTSVLDHAVNDRDKLIAEVERLREAIALHKERWAEHNQPPAIWDSTLWHAVGLWPEPERAADF